MSKKQNMQGITVKKDEDFSEWYSQVVQKAELADIRFGVQGFIVHRPWGFFITRKIYEYLEKEVEAQGHLPFLFPSVVKEENLMKEEEHANFTPEVFWVSEAGDKKIEERFALKPTGEAQIYPVYSLWFRSHKDLPFKGYQSRISAFRSEKTTRPFLRGREFMFFETHDVFNTHQEALDQIQLDLKTCEDVIRKQIKIPFFYFKRPAWDKFMGADATFTPDTLMPDGKRNQLASTHDLGHNFSKAFDIKVRGKDGEQHFAWQTCFGPGVWRIMAALIGIHGDDKGLVLPFDMAPTQVVIVPITLAKKPELSKKVMQACEKLEQDLRTAGYRVCFDTRDMSPGARYSEWELKGVPVRIEVGPRDLEQEQATIVLRNAEEKKAVPLSDVVKDIPCLAEKLDATIAKKSEEYFNDRVRDADSLKDAIKTMEKHRGFIRVPWCSVDWEGEKCEEQLKDKTNGARVCGTFYPKEEKVKAGQKCIVCEKEAKHIVYLAKSY